VTLLNCLLRCRSSFWYSHILASLLFVLVCCCYSCSCFSIPNISFPMLYIKFESDLSFFSLHCLVLPSIGLCRRHHRSWTCHCIIHPRPHNPRLYYAAVLIDDSEAEKFLALWGVSWLWTFCVLPVDAVRCVCSIIWPHLNFRLIFRRVEFLQI
jgi:hypothetical protein